MGPFGIQEMMVIVILALLLFGPKKLPELARLLGKGLTEFRRAKNELKSTFDTHMRELEREANLQDALKNPSPSPVYNPYTYLADESGKTSDFGYNGTPSEPPVETHAVAASEAPALPSAPAVAGTIARSSPNAPAEAEPEEHHA